MKQNVVLLACGSFNPPTNMHLRMFEIARDYLHKSGQCSVVGGLISPVHDSYGKKELVPGIHRCEMVRLSLQSSDWIKVSDWECLQETWCRTRRVLQHHQNTLNSLNNDRNINSPSRRLIDNENDEWIKDLNVPGHVNVKLICGADLLESFSVPGLWADEDISTIVGEHGLVVITRSGTNPQQFIYESDVLTRFQQNIIIVPEWISNEVSSTKVRRALRRQESVKYLIDDKVIDYIQKHGLYGTQME